MSEFCVFCYKATDAKVVDSSGKDFDSTVKHNVVNKFSKILDRFSSAAVEKEFRDLNHSEKLSGSKWLSCCGPCTAIIGGFCEDFHKLKCLEMAMEWKLQRLKDSMEHAGRVPASWFKLQQFFKIQKFIEGPTWNNDDILEHLKIYRDNIFKQSTRRITQSKPRVLIQRWDIYDGTEPLSDNECGVQPHCHSTLSSLRDLARNVKVEDDDKIAETCLLFEEDKEYTAMRKPKQDYDSDKDWCDDNNYSSEDEGKLSSNDKSVNSDDEDNISSDDKNSNPFQCKICKKTYLTAQRLSEHKSRVHRKPSHKCPTCHKVFKVRLALRRQQLRHMDPSTWKHICSVCDRPFATKYGMQTHMETHKGEAEINVVKTSCESILPPVPCPKCGKMFATEMRLKDHLKKFHAPRSLKCSKCSQRYKTKDDLRKHEVRAHTDPSTWKFKCSDCDARFVYNSMLLAHIKQRHRDPQTWDHKCGICEKPFMRKSKMLQHMETCRGREETTCVDDELQVTLPTQQIKLCAGYAVRDSRTRID